jgi:cholesterol oxidase
MNWLSKNLVELQHRIASAKNSDEEKKLTHFDVLIVGSGYGGSIVAARLAKRFGKSLRIGLLEKGREYLPGEYPTDTGDVFKHIRWDREGKSLPTGDADALINIIAGEHVTAVVGQGLGGTSQLNANVAIRAGAAALAGWAEDAPNGLTKQYALAEQMLITKSSSSRPVFEKDEAFRRVFPGATREDVQLAVHFEDVVESAPGVKVAARACTACGNCATGCNYGSKNTLTQTYLPIAFEHGVEIYTGASVANIALPDNGGDKKSKSVWEVHTYPTQFEKTATKNQRALLTADHVVLAAGAIGSTEILLRSQNISRKKIDDDEDGTANETIRETLQFSKMLGQRFSGNGDGLAFSFWESKQVSGVGLFSHELPSNYSEAAGIGRTGLAGPTITSMARVKAADGREVLIQNGVVPGVLGDILAELLTTSALTGDLASDGWHAKRRKKGSDPLATQPEATTNTQLMLTMVEDGSPYRLAFKRPSGIDSLGSARRFDPDYLFQRAFIQSESLNSSLAKSVDDLLMSSVDNTKDGVFVSNPNVSLIDKKLRKLLEGAQPGGGALTVHPLGGCSMGDGWDKAVVSKAFKVFRFDKDQFPPRNSLTYEGLYVCDGAIFPRSLGVNPFLTIAALAEKFSEQLIAALPQKDYKDSNTPLKPRPFVPIYRAPKEPSSIKFYERLAAPLTHDGVYDARDADQLAYDTQAVDDLSPIFYGSAFNYPKKVSEFIKDNYWLKADAQHGKGQKDFSRLAIPPMLAMKVSFKLDDVGAFLRGNKELNSNEVTAELALEFDTSKLHPRSEAVWPYDLPSGEKYVLKAKSGTVNAFALKPGLLFVTTAIAMWNWFWLRGKEEIIVYLAKFLKTWLDFKRDRTPGFAKASLLDIKSRLVTSISYAAKAGLARTFAYKFMFEGNDGQQYCLVGSKCIQFRKVLNPWRAISEIEDAQLLRIPSNDVVWRGRLSFDVREFVRDLLPEAQANAKHTPDVLLQTGKMGMYLARVLLQHGMWHFRKPAYKPYIPRTWEYPQDMVGLAREPFDIVVPAGDSPWMNRETSSTEFSKIRLTRYSKPEWAQGTEKPKGAIVFLHGLLHSAVCYSSKNLVDRVEKGTPIANLSMNSETPQNMVEYFCTQGYECWLLDMRVSTANLERRKAWTLDQVADYDVPKAFRFASDDIARRYGKEVPLYGFAHCMGAAVMSMAVLSGKIEEALKGERKLAGLVLCQFGPFMVPSHSNMARGEVASFAKDFMGMDYYNPVSDDASTAEQFATDDKEDMFDSAGASVLFDRLAWSYPVDHREARAHDASFFPRNDLSICNRLSLMIGENWVHENLSSKTHENLEEFIGPTRLETFWQTLYFGLKGRVVEYSGLNAYVSDKNMGNFNFPVLFLHGQRNGLFHPRSTFLALQHLRNRDEKGDFQYFLVEGYGHLENVLGKDAHKKVFPRLVEFFGAHP